MNYKKIFLAAMGFILIFTNPSEIYARFSTPVTTDMFPHEYQDSLLTVEAINNFPEGITFVISSPDLVSFSDVKINYKVNGQSNKTGYRTSPVTDQGPLLLSINSQRAGTYIPPGTTISYFAEAFGDDSILARTKPKEILYLDPNFQWQKLSTSMVNIYYHDTSSASNAETTLSIAESTAEFALPMFNHSPKQKFNLVLYSNYSDMEKILPFRSATTAENLMTQGMAFTEERTAVIYAGSRSLKSTTSHEFMHLLLHDAVGRFHTRLPAWLDEGLAEYGNQSPANDYQSALNQAISSKTDKHIKFLNTFSGSPADIIAAYGKGSSVVSYLASEYGRNSFAELIDNFKMSLSNDQAFQLTYGITLDELEIEWKKSLGEEPDSNAEPTVPQHSPAGNQPSDTDSSSRAIGSCQSSGSDTPLDLAAILLVIAPFCMFGRKSH